LHYDASLFLKIGGIMQNILVINSSASGDQSVSRSLVAYTVQRLKESNPELVFTSRDVGEVVIPHLTAETMAGVRGVAETGAELATRELSDELIAEVIAADLLVIGAPMYNFSIPTTLRTWFDHVVRPRVTFAYGAAGPEGLIKGKRAIVIESRGGFYSEGPAKSIDFQEPYLKQLLGFIGITEVEFIHAEKIGYGADAIEEALSTARLIIRDSVTRITGTPAKFQPSEENASITIQHDSAEALN
jgi:FMN-dependent NADH-azoreductase